MLLSVTHQLNHRQFFKEADEAQKEKEEVEDQGEDEADAG